MSEDRSGNGTEPLYQALLDRIRAGDDVATAHRVRQEVETARLAPVVVDPEPADPASNAARHRVAPGGEERSPSFDATDRALLRRMLVVGREPGEVLAAAVGIGAAECAERIGRLTAAGVVAGTHSRAEPATATEAPADRRVAQVAMIALRVRPLSRAVVTPLVEVLVGLPQVVSVRHIAGAHDVLVEVSTDDADALGDLLLDEIGSRPEVVDVRAEPVLDIWSRSARATPAGS